MADESEVLPPGEYTLPGLDRVLVIEGVAYLRRPAAPRTIPGFEPAPAPALEVIPAPAPATPPSWLTTVLAIVAAIAGAWFGPSILGGGTVDPNPPAPVAPVDPAPTPTPEPGGRPRPRPDWMGDVEPPPVVRASPQQPQG